MLINLLLSIISGVLFAASFPDIGIGWLMFVAFVPLFLAVARTRGGWGAFACGLISQTVAWLVMVPWVIRVMSHYGGLPYAAGVAIFVALALILGLYGALFALLVHRLLAAGAGARLRTWLLVPLAWAAV